MSSISVQQVPASQQKIPCQALFVSLYIISRKSRGRNDNIPSGYCIRNRRQIKFLNSFAINIRQDTFYRNQYWTIWSVNLIRSKTSLSWQLDSFCLFSRTLYRQAIQIMTSQLGLTIKRKIFWIFKMTNIAAFYLSKLKWSRIIVSAVVKSVTYRHFKEAVLFVAAEIHYTTAQSQTIE